MTELGGAAIDIDTEGDYDAARERFAEWCDAQAKRGEALHGALRAEDSP